MTCVKSCFAKLNAFYLFVFGGEVSGAVWDLCSSILNDLTVDGNVCHTILPTEGVWWLQEGKDAASCDDQINTQTKIKDLNVSMNICFHRKNNILPCSFITVMLTWSLPILAIPTGTSTACTSSSFFSSSSSLMKSGIRTSTDSTPSWNSTAPAASTRQIRW